MFLLNSCLGLFSAACSRRHPFSRSYGVILPSSLTILLPPALGFSPHPPVSVYGTGHNETIAAFLDGLLNSFPTLFRSASHLRLIRGFFLPHIYCACTGFLIPGSVLPSVSLQFCSLRVQESQPAVHRLRISGKICCGFFKLSARIGNGATDLSHNFSHRFNQIRLLYSAELV